jgi:hypothetical protein
MERYRCRKSGLYMICIPSSENQDWPWSQSGRKAEQVFSQTCPSLAAHLSQFKEDLITRQDQGRFWWELRSCDYWSDFDSPKMVWQEMAWFTRFAVDYGKQIVLNTAYVLPSTDPLLMCFLNSPLAWWYMWRTAQHGKDEVLRLIRDYTEQFPIAEPDQKTKGQLEQVAGLLVEHGESINKFEQEGAAAIQKVIRIGIDAASTFDLASRTPDKFIDKMSRLAESKKLDDGVRQSLLAIHTSLRGRQVALLSRQLELEERVAELVEISYGLTDEERSLLRRTRPPRDPIDVLGRKIGGHDDPTDIDEPEME